LRELVVGKALQKPPDGDAAFEPRQAQTRALVHAKAKGQVFIASAAQVQLFWLFIDGWVTVGRANAQRDQSACG
jgi:hypothetical protein